jgi:hypothetical protein
LRRTPVLRALQALPYRVYERYGVRVYSIGYKLKSGKWAFRYDCPVGDARAVAKLRKKAIIQSTRVTNDAPIGGFAGLVNAWFEWQEGLPPEDARKLAQSTITGYRAEADNPPPLSAVVAAGYQTRQLGETAEVNVGGRWMPVSTAARLGYF